MCQISIVDISISHRSLIQSILGSPLWTLLLHWPCLKPYSIRVQSNMSFLITLSKVFIPIPLCLFPWTKIFLCMYVPCPKPSQTKFHDFFLKLKLPISFLLHTHSCFFLVTFRILLSMHICSPSILIVVSLLPNNSILWALNYCLIKMSF